MAEDLQGNLQNYKLQLQQVEAALTTDTDNEDLLKLKKDLQEVIDLTEDLIKTQSAPTEEPSTSEQKSGGADADSGPQPPFGPTSAGRRAARQWKVGDKCIAQWTEDQGFYPATIEELLEDGSCTITFTEYGNTEVTQISLLKSLEEGDAQRDVPEGPSAKKAMSKKDLMATQREYKKKKAQKKAQRMKAMEEEREGEKNKWLDFNAKVFSKTNKGRVKKSIFATPDGGSGRVGVGTCGVGGKPMTDYQHQEKWKK